MDVDRMAGSQIAVFVVVFAMLGFAPQIAIADSSLPSYDRIRELSQPRSISDFELTDHESQDFRFSQLQGHIVFVFFGFTNCPDVCPLAMQRLREFESAPDVKLDKVTFLLVSVDGERDSPSVLGTYLASFSKRFIGLTGDPSIVKKIAKEFSAAFYKEGPTGAHANYDVSHSPQVFIVDRNGLLRAESYNASIDALRGVMDALNAEQSSVSTH